MECTELASRRDRVIEVEGEQKLEDNEHTDVFVRKCKIRHRRWKPKSVWAGNSAGGPGFERGTVVSRFDSKLLLVPEDVGQPEKVLAWNFHGTSAIALLAGAWKRVMGKKNNRNPCCLRKDVDWRAGAYKW
jgi:hypothetical protein